MKRILMTTVAILIATGALAHEGHDAKTTAKASGKAAGKEVTLRGEVVDSGCYLAKGARGADHKECANKCISGGMPMGLVTADNKFYLLTPNHQNADPYESLKQLAAAQVEVSGKAFTRNGVTMLDVTGVKSLAN